ncbi:hypothetical protein HMPREF3164_04935 [Rothia sp. HMSC08A08]|nr:hypothetical protein HMPREF3164_04935 [Rothia sp. HMSC08A08]
MYISGKAYSLKERSANQLIPRIRTELILKKLIGSLLTGTYSRFALKALCLFPYGIEHSMSADDNVSVIRCSVHAF